MIKCGMLASKNAIARLTTTRTNTIGYIMVCMYVSLAHTQRGTSALTECPRGVFSVLSFLRQFSGDQSTYTRSVYTRRENKEQKG